jgi:hypothetical protein
MSSDEPTTGTTNPRRRILWLVVGHVVVGLMGACFAGRYPTLRVAAFIGLVFSQTSLLAIWGSLGVGPWWKRLVGVVVGVGYLGFLLGVGISELTRRVALDVLLATMFVACPLLIVRSFRVVVQSNSSRVGSVGRIQFTIRHLMILTFVVACLISIGKWVQPFPHVGKVVWLFGNAVTFGVVGVLPVGFVLATKQPVLFGVGWVVVGAFAGYCLGRMTDFDVGIWMTMTSVEAMVLVASLVVVRSCGYRLVRLPSRRQGEG